MGEDQLPYDQMWDGFWIRSFSNETLVISCAFDRLLYRNYDFIFNGVIFFNIPADWRDTVYEGESPFTEIDEAEFSDRFGEFDTKGKKIVELNMFLPQGNSGSLSQHYFHIVSDEAFVMECFGKNCRPEKNYTDPVSIYLSKENRADKF